MSPTISSSSIYHLTHELHQTITRSIDTALSWDQLNSPPVNYTLVRPIVEKYTQRRSALTEKRHKSGNAGEGYLRPERQKGSQASETEVDVKLGAVLYALMANRVQFITLAESDLSYAPLQNARAAFCELLAMKILRSFPHPEDEAELAESLVHGWCAFEGAPREVWDSMGEDKNEIQETRGSALELAIITESKHFLSLPLIQHLVTQIYNGHLIYLSVSSRSLISDSYISERTQKRRQASHSSYEPARPESSIPNDRGGLGPASRRSSLSNNAEDSIGTEVFVYDPYEAGWLDHQRLRVPRWRNRLECLSLAILIVLFIATLTTRNIHRPHPFEIVYIVFTFGFILDEFAASKEHGWTVYSANAWNAFDLVYIANFLLFFALRSFALITHSPTTSDLAFDILSCAACILFPRLVFYLIKDQVVIIALRAMIARFLGFMGLTILAFSGICFCLWTLGRATWTVKQIIWLMLQIWFGSSYLGFSASESFHPIFGPIILISYAALCNVLLITILIAILSNKFAEINGNAQAEHLFQRVLKTVEGVRSDAIFSYLPPVNLLAFLLLMPLSWICSPRTLHRINVFSVRLTNFPILFAISAYERWSYRSRRKALRLKGGSAEPGHKSRLMDSWLAGGSEAVIASVFEAGPPANLEQTSVQVTTGSTGTSTTDSESDILSGNTKQRQKRDPSTKFNRSGASSPLAKLYGEPGNTRGSKDGRKFTRRGPDEEQEVETLRKELAEMRGSQLRMEEMLGKLLAGRSD